MGGRVRLGSVVVGCVEPGGCGWGFADCVAEDAEDGGWLHEGGGWVDESGDAHEGGGDGGVFGGGVLESGHVGVAEAGFEGAVAGDGGEVEVAAGGDVPGGVDGV